MPDVLTIGAATADIFVKSGDFTINSDPKSPTGNLLSIPYSFKSEMNLGLITSGGGATNTAVSFSRLGLTSSCLSLAGHDFFGDLITSDLERENVSIRLFIKKLSEQTDYSVILLGPDGGRTVIVNRGRTSLSTPDISWDKLNDYKMFYITSLEGNLDLLEELIGFAKDNQIKVCLNPGNRELKQSKILSPLLKNIDFLLLNKTEAEMLTNQSFNSKAFWDALETFTQACVAITNGRDGAYVVYGNQSHYAPIINTLPKDETGAGDAFGSAFSTALFQGKSLEECLLWGMHNAASVVSALGAKTGLLTISQLKSNLQKINY